MIDLMSRGCISSYRFVCTFPSLFFWIAFLVKVSSYISCSCQTTSSLILLLSDRLSKNYSFSTISSQPLYHSFQAILFISLPFYSLFQRMFMDCFFISSTISVSSNGGIFQSIKIYDCLPTLLMTTHTEQMPSKNSRSVSDCSSKLCFWLTKN